MLDDVSANAPLVACVVDTVQPLSSSPDAEKDTPVPTPNEDALLDALFVLPVP